MRDFIEWYREGGWAMHAITLLLIFGSLLQGLAFVLAIVGRVTGKVGGLARALAVCAALVALSPGCMGLIGYEFGISRVEAALLVIDPEQRAVVQAAGEEEASHNLSFGFGGAICMLLPAVITFLVAPSKPVDPSY